MLGPFMVAGMKLVRQQLRQLRQAPQQVSVGEFKLEAERGSFMSYHGRFIGARRCMGKYPSPFLVDLTTCMQFEGLAGEGDGEAMAVCVVAEAVAVVVVAELLAFWIMRPTQWVLVRLDRPNKVCP